MPLDVYGYDGAPDRPFPPSTGWALATHEDTNAATAARELAAVLPCWSYVDAPVEGELYRFFSYKTGVGTREHVAALRFVGVDGARNQPPDASTLGADAPPPPDLNPPPLPPDPGLIPPQLMPPDVGGAGGHLPGDSACSSYVADSSNVTANGVANEILLQGTAQGKPAPWTPDGGYHAIINGTRWYFLMKQGAECAPYQKCVWAFRCVPRAGGGGGGGGSGGGNPPAGAITSSGGMLVIGTLLAAGAVAGIYAITKGRG